jgi:hypothetical protein
MYVQGVNFSATATTLAKFFEREGGRVLSARLYWNRRENEQHRCAILPHMHCDCGTLTGSSPTVRSDMMLLFVMHCKYLSLLSTTAMQVELCDAFTTASLN